MARARCDPRKHGGMDVRGIPGSSCLRIARAFHTKYIVAIPTFSGSHVTVLDIAGSLQSQHRPGEALYSADIRVVSSLRKALFRSQLQGRSFALRHLYHAAWYRNGNVSLQISLQVIG